LSIQNYRKNVVLALLVICSAGSSIFAQAPRIPRMPDGKPNLTGLWQAITTADWNVEDHSAQAGPFFQLGATGAIPPGQSIVEGGSIPYKPEALIKRNENFANRLKLDPEIKCYMPVCLAGRTCPSHYRLTSLKRTSCLRTNTRPRIGRQHGPSQISGRGRVDGNIEWTMAGRHAGR